ncbi:MAC/perforin domain-containing protein [Pedobacter chitinilyticus]|nr:MAC/perforin domain-containing protein [Pedobacter chitinilyticus]
MKKLYYLTMILIGLFLISCSKSELQNNPKEEPAPLIKKPGGGAGVMIAGDGKYDLLGYGYDMTGDAFALENASDAPIIDMKRFETDFAHRVNTPTTTEGKQDYYYGATAYEYVKDINRKKDFSASVSLGPKVPAKDGEHLFTGNAGYKDSSNNNYSFNSRYSFAHFEATYRIKKIQFNGDVDINLLKNYLTPEFLNNIVTYSADALVERYGTHVLTGISLGGRLRFDFSAALVNQATTEGKNRTVTGGLGFFTKLLGINLSTTLTTQEMTKSFNESRERRLSLSFSGGTNSGRSVSFDSNGNSSETVNISSWEQSVNANNCALIGVENAVPLQEFITDPIKKEQVRIAIENYIKARQIKLEYSKVLLYNFYSKQLGHIFTIDSNFGTTNSGWIRIFNDPIYVYDSQKPGSVPVYIMQHRTRSVYCVTANNTIDLDVWKEANYPVFYAYTAKDPNVYPIYQFYHPKTPSYGYFYDLTYRPLLNGWVENGIKFYAFNSPL